MGQIKKSIGLTPSERFLAALANRSFLSLWSYPNVFRDKGKELSDLLVVCGSKIIVFSDKSIDYPTGVVDQLAWSRWYRRAVGKSAHQLERAVSWIRKHPDRLFLDAQCEDRFPIDLPRAGDMEIHSIIVARGAARACIRHFGSGSGSLGLLPLSSRTREAKDVPPFPFFIGNPCPNDRDFYHVLDDVSLGVLLTELDTITDFTDYLSKKERLFQGNHLLSAHGEEDLLAIYLKDVNEFGEHDFVTTSKAAISGDDVLVVEGGSYDSMRQRGEYKRKKAADRVSYVWDELIESFAKNIIADSTYMVRGFEGFHEPTKSELGLRHMALVSRLERRSHAQAIRGAFDLIGKRDRFFRAMLPGTSYEDRSTGFFILLVKRDSFLKDFSDDDYRKFRANLSMGYAWNLLRSQSYLKRIVGIATEGEFARRSRSEDLIYAEQPNWTPDRIAEADEMSEKLEIFRNGLPNESDFTHIRPLEYPPSHYSSHGGNIAPYSYIAEPSAKQNRQQRRAARARIRRRL